MAFDMLLKITGPDIKGESKIDGHIDEIDVLAWSWGASNSGNAHTGGGQGAGKVNVQDLSFTKWVDAATPDLLAFCCSGRHFDKAVLVVRKAGGDTPVDYLTITMQELIVASVSTGGSGGEDRLTENVTLNFAKVEVVYNTQTAKGAKDKSPKMGWDIQANKKI